MKGQITIQITWAFAIIAGILILTMILTGVMSEEKESDNVASISMLSYFKTQITSAANSQESFNKITLPNAEFKIMCDEYDTSGILMGESFTSTRFQAIFSQEEMKSRDLYTWSKDWNVYAGSDRVLYLTTPDTLIVVVKEGEWENYIAEIPEGILVVTVPPSKISYARDGYEHYRFVFFGTTPTFDRSYLGTTEKVTAVSYSTSSVNFYELGTNNWELKGSKPYFGDALKYGALFSENPKTYACNVEKSLLKVKLQAIINRERINNIMGELYDERGEDDECYRMMKGKEDNYGNYNGLRELYNETIGSPDVASIAGSSDRIKRIGEDLIKGRGCPTL